MKMMVTTMMMMEMMMTTVMTVKCDQIIAMQQFNEAVLLTLADKVGFFAIL